MKVRGGVTSEEAKYPVAQTVGERKEGLRAGTCTIMISAPCATRGNYAGETNFGEEDAGRQGRGGWPCRRPSSSILLPTLSTR